MRTAIYIIYIYIIYICISDLHTISRHEPCNVKPITDLKNDDGCETHLSRNNLWPQTGSWMSCTIYLLQKVDLSIRKRRISRRKPCARNEFVFFSPAISIVCKKSKPFLNERIRILGRSYERSSQIEVYVQYTQ